MRLFKICALSAMAALQVACGGSSGAGAFVQDIDHEDSLLQQVRSADELEQSGEIADSFTYESMPSKWVHVELEQADSTALANAWVQVFKAKSLGFFPDPDGQASELFEAGDLLGSFLSDSSGIAEGNVNLPVGESQVVIRVAVAGFGDQLLHLRDGSFSANLSRGEI